MNSAAKRKSGQQRLARIKTLIQDLKLYLLCISVYIVCLPEILLFAFLAVSSACLLVVSSIVPFFFLQMNNRNASKGLVGCVPRSLIAALVGLFELAYVDV
jgi:hypothetical protein